MKPASISLSVGAVLATAILGVAAPDGTGARASAESAESSTTAPARPGLDRYVIDPAHTSVTFAVRHLGLSKVRGSFSGVAGAVLWSRDQPELSSATVVIDVTSLDTGNKRRDEDLRGNFFETERFPRIVFESTAFEETEEGHLLRGNLTIRDSTHDVSFPVELLGTLTDSLSGERRVGFEGGLEIDRTDYGVRAEDHPAEIRFVIGHDIEIELQVEARIPGYRAASFGSENGRSVGAELADVLEDGGVEAARERHAEIVEAPDGFDTSARELALLGFKRLEADDPDGAALAFELYREAQPSATADEWLGHAYAAAGRTEEAIEAYERALAEDPWRPSSLEMLRRLEP